MMRTKPNKRLSLADWNAIVETERQSKAVWFAHIEPSRVADYLRGFDEGQGWAIAKLIERGLLESKSGKAVAP